MARRVDGASIVRPLALGTWSGSPAIVHEAFEGQPLEEHAREPMPAEHFLPLAERIVRALGDVHAAGVVR